MKVLSVLTKGETVASTMDAAVLAAASVPCMSLEVLEVVLEPALVAASPEEMDIKQLRALVEGSPAERRQEIVNAFHAWKDQQPPGTPEFTWRTITGAQSRSVIAERSADVALMVISHNNTIDAAHAYHFALFSMHRPVLLVPEGWRAGPRKTFAHIAVGLTDDAVTRRAVEAATPWLTAAQRISAICLTDEKNADVLKAIMHQAKIDAEFDIPPYSPQKIGVQLVHEADRLGADILIAGVYRHSKALQWLLGHTTRELVNTMDLPLFLAH
ncbi:hypothetical protein MRS76_10215 [Rhizobiaceae bacterium n13]|uniref:Universal stress protein n=1 Tax=Ferirhizobium litorale TaxID=2927786 RepID=A0AAE3U3H7_9HYPH|nr:hypothetical protein [Fererhizobium litorale]MDI7862333.1 hypothetical protein [Fererhizobium litorale]MDI7922393.1 hypothetical protein [Fererhizobium litorale]